MASQLVEALTERLPLIGTTIIVSLLALLAQRLLARDPLANIPWVGVELGDESKRRQAYLRSARPFYKEGYDKFKKGIYRLSTIRTGETVVVSPVFLPELKNLPDDVLSMKEAIEESMEAKYTGIRADDQILPHTVKANLTPALVRINPSLAEEVDRTLRTEMPACKDWTEVNINSKLLRIVAIVSGRVFVGPELCRNEEYIDAAINFTVDVIKARRAVQMVSPWLRPFKAPFLPEVKRVAEREKMAKDLLSPFITARRKAEREEAGYEKPDDMLQWMMDADKFGDKLDAEVARMQLILSFAAIHTTTMTATNVFYNLAAHPELVTELRQEVRTVLAEHNHQFTSPAMQSMKKLDSFLKETLRVYPPAFASFQRKVLKPITLSNGTLLPVGTTIEIPSYGVSRDSDTFPDPETFDGLRFYKMREASESFNKSADGTKSTLVEAAAHNQFVSVSPNSLTFGYGRHACPGRFFAANEIKMIVARAVLTWDVRNVGGVGGRYPNLEIGMSYVPDPRRGLEFMEV